ncbi:hypothetical protein EWM64_g5183 [Hericium alpestre]|uniref:Protein-S-isoprenylcysteine O-methyltransferase n=1 Tax=Hericium alpestre TaxID=135208 RepID=A0A4Y9ZZ86_9AGAM|nr:hypothetical protein EWM64_g5183 [Hericium alpestre]
MSILSLYKLPILLTETALVWRSYTPPALPTRSEEVKSTGPTKYVDRYVPVLAFLFKLNCALSTVAETALILASHVPDHPLSQTVLSALELIPGGASHIQITSEFLAGAAIAAGGAFLRIACFRRMGKMFTFELALRDEHKLITDGPYGLVRHPSYTGLLLNMVGSAIVHFGTGSWFRECGWFGAVRGRRYMMLWFLFRIVEMTNLTLRTWKEDGMLREQFGDAWKKWARDTPYRLIPFVF